MDQFIRDDLLREESSQDYVISSECNNEDGQERRFVLVEVKDLSSRQPHARSSTDTASTRTKADDSFAKHQVNYSATKYIKP